MLMPLVNPRLDDESEDENDEEKRTLFCANLDERVTEDLLYEVFLQAGPIESTRIPKDRNGRQRSFGFITYMHACAVQYAMQLFQGLSLYRKTLTIKMQGNPTPSPMRNNNSPNYNPNRINYDNSSLRGTNFMPYNDSPLKNPFKTNTSSELPLNSMAPQEKTSISRRINYDNSSLRGTNFMAYNDSPLLNPFKTSISPEFPLDSMMPQENTDISRRQASNESPYHRNTSRNNDRKRERERQRDKDREREREHDKNWDRDHDRKRHYNNSSNRNSGQRTGGKSRR